MHKQSRIDIGDISLNVVTAGPEDGPPLILLHGFPEFWYGWRHQVEPLAKAGFRVIVPDQRGYNLSDKPRGIKPYDLDRLALDVVELASVLGYDTFNLAGHDWGAAVAWHVAEHHTERLRKLAILNVPHPYVIQQTLRRSIKQMIKSWYIGWFQLPLLPELSLYLFGDGMMRATSQDSTFAADDFTEYQQAWRQPRAATGMINWYRAMARRTLRTWNDYKLTTPEITVPTLVLWGLNDAALTAEMAGQSVELCTDGTLITYPDATHWLQHDEVEAVNRELIGFFGA